MRLSQGWVSFCQKKYLNSVRFNYSYSWLISENFKYTVENLQPQNTYTFLSKSHNYFSKKSNREQHFFIPLMKMFSYLLR